MPMLEHPAVRDGTSTVGPVVGGLLRCRTASLGPAEFAPFGVVLRHDGPPGTRTDFSHVFETRAALPPRLHVNQVEPSALPLGIQRLERHPTSWQAFLPLDVSRYLVCVAGSQADGSPDLDHLHAWILDGHTGIAFAPGVWHVGATVLDRTGHFAVIWPRLDRDTDTEWATLPSPLTLTR
jgi:ureidoglycolate lyase